VGQVCPLAWQVIASKSKTSPEAHLVHPVALPSHWPPQAASQAAQAPALVHSFVDQKLQFGVAKIISELKQEVQVDASEQFAQGETHAKQVPGFAGSSYCPSVQA